MSTTIALWSIIAIQVIVSGVSLEARSWLMLMGQGASLALLGYIAWKIHRRTPRVRRKCDDL